MLSPESIDRSVPFSADESRVGSILGRYQLTRMLGQGGMGVVYEAIDTTLDRRVAVKLLTESFSGDSEAAQRLMREAQASARLNHPNVVTIHHVGRQDSYSYIVMELLEGGSVQQQVEQRGQLPWQEATRIVAQVCRGLQAAHAAKLIHRDIKPSNILRSAKGVAKLADFGLVRMLDDSQLRLTATGILVGSPYYMSPEQCASDRVDELSDLYSLGATYFALLVGRPPYRGTQPVQICFEHCSAPVPDPRDFVATTPDTCAAIVMRAMSKRPEDRFTSAGEMLSALKQTLQTGATLQSESTGVPSRDAARRRTDRMERTELESRAEPRQQKRAASTSAAAEPGRRGKRSRQTRRGLSSLLNSRLRIGVLLAGVASVVCAAAWFFWDDADVGESAMSVAVVDEGTPLAVNPAARHTQKGGAAKTTSLSEFRRTIDEIGSRQFDVPAEVSSVVVSPRGDWFASTEHNGDGGYSVWNLLTGERWSDFGLGNYGSRSNSQDSAGFHGATATMDGRFLLTGQSGGVGTGVFVWSVDLSRTTPKKQFDRMLRPVSGDCRSVSISCDGVLVAAAADFLDRPGQLGERSTVARVRLFGLDDGQWQGDLKLSARRVFASVFSPTDNQLLATLDSFGMLSLWDVSDVNWPRQQWEVLPTEEARANNVQASAPRNAGLAFSSDGRRLAVAYGRDLQIWSVAEERRLAATRVTGAAFSCVAFSPDGRLLATTGTRSDQVSLRRTDTLESQRELTGHTAAVNAVTFVPGDSVLISGGLDRRVILWECRRWLDAAASSFNNSAGSADQ